MEENKSGLFRKNSLDSIAGPEQMNDYIRVIGPSVWVLLAAVIILLIGVIVWGVFGRLETTENTVAVVNNNVAICYVDKETVGEVDTKDDMRVGGQIAQIESVSTVAPVQASGVYDRQTLESLGLTGYEMLYPVTASTDLPDGSYTAELIVERIRPMSFITGDVN
ncbi:MAG: hypothetical protein IJ075_03395 [Lachnospiraceae bacterium]|nr:hypothetical protein [Lachnospiraceae bacterium]